MPFSRYSLKDVKHDLNIQIIETERLFVGVKRTDISEFLHLALAKYIPLALAINTEKSRSEWIIAPILVELKEKLQGKISIFSGKRLDVQPEIGLDGYCDYIVSLSPEQYYIAAPILAIVEAKKEDIIEGLGQCIATMYAASLFNEYEQLVIPCIYGAVTTGTVWKFLRLEGKSAFIDQDEYYVNDIEQLMGILLHMVQQKD